MNVVKTGRYFAEQSPTLALFQAKLANTFRPHPTTSLRASGQDEPVDAKRRALVEEQFKKWTKPKNAVTGCIIWTGAKYHGHPVIAVAGKSMAAWRAIRIYMTGIQTLADAKPNRTCGFNLCVNPDHLTVR